MNKKTGICVLSIAAMLLFTACSSKTEYTDSALGSAMAGDAEAAEEMLKEAEAHGEDEKLIMRAKGITCMAKGKYEEALGFFDQALSLANGRVSETEIDVAHYEAAAQYKSGDIEGAIATCSAILGLREDDADTYFMRGGLNLENGDYDAAISDYNALVDLDNKNIDSYIDIYEALSSKGYDEAGQDYLDRAAKLQNKLTDFQKGRLFYYQQDYEMARSYFEKARGNEGDRVIEYLGMTYEALGDLNYASSLYKTYLEKQPEDATMHNRLGLCLIELEEYDEAIKCFDAAIEQKGSSTAQTAAFNRVVAYERKGDFEKASSLMKDYMKIYPADEKAEKEYDFLKTR